MHKGTPLKITEPLEATFLSCILYLQLALEQAERDRVQAEDKFKKDVKIAATSKSSAMENLQRDFEVKEEILKAEASQALQSARRECKVAVNLLQVLGSPEQ